MRTGHRQHSFLPCGSHPCRGRALNAALGWAQIARKRAPENENAADTLGWVYYKLGSHVLARNQLQFAVSKQPDNPVFQYHLAMIY